MTDDPIEKTEESKNSEKDEPKNLPLHNPLKEDDDRHFTQEDLENEQRYKEALTERD